MQKVDYHGLRASCTRAASAGQEQKGSFCLSGSASASPLIAHHLRVHTWGREITLPSPCSSTSPEQGTRLLWQSGPVAVSTV